MSTFSLKLDFYLVLFLTFNAVMSSRSLNRYVLTVDNVSEIKYLFTFLLQRKTDQFTRLRNYVKVKHYLPFS